MFIIFSAKKMASILWYATDKSHQGRIQTYICGRGKENTKGNQLHRMTPNPFSFRWIKTGSKTYCKQNMYYRIVKQTIGQKK